MGKRDLPLAALDRWKSDQTSIFVLPPPEVHVDVDYEVGTALDTIRYPRLNPQDTRKG